MEPVTLESTEEAPKPILVERPALIEPIEIEILPNSIYEDILWDRVVDTINAAESEVAKAKAIKRLADLAYDIALKQRRAVQVPRDYMIFSDKRTPSELGRLSGIGRARCAQVREAIQKRENAGEGSSE
jgi:hypothetical protein